MTTEHSRRSGGKDGRLAAVGATAAAGREGSAPDPLAFEEALGRLDETVSALETGKLPLEDAIRLYEEGVHLAQRCQELLDQAELRISRLVAAGDAPADGLAGFALDDFDLDADE
jgi:exodeoxyribonuclease VII small subunit